VCLYKTLPAGQIAEIWLLHIFDRGRQTEKECQMINHESKNEVPLSVPRGGRLRRSGAYIAAAVAGVTLVGAFASSPVGVGLSHRVLANVSGMTAAAAPLDGGSGPGFAVDWRGDLLNGAIEAVVEVRADRMIRHLAVEIDATAEQQDKLRAIVRGAVKDLLPVREKLLAARATARELLTQQTIDRAAIERLRADQIAVHDAASKRVVGAIADAAEVLTPEQRRKLAAMLPPRGGSWGAGSWGGGPLGGGPWGRGPWGNWGGFGRN
jgi:protein CpxP